MSVIYYNGKLGIYKNINKINIRTLLMIYLNKSIGFFSHIKQNKT